MKTTSGSTPFYERFPYGQHPEDDYPEGRFARLLRADVASQRAGERASAILRRQERAAGLHLMELGTDTPSREEVAFHLDVLAAEGIAPELVL